MIFIYPVGVPLFYAVVLFRARHVLDPSPTRTAFSVRNVLRRVHGDPRTYSRGRGRGRGRGGRGRGRHHYGEHDAAKIESRSNAIAKEKTNE